MLVFLNGNLVPYESATVHVEDRGFQFSDAVYEVMAVYKSRVVDGAPHYARLERSLAELEIPQTLSQAKLDETIHDLIRRNNIDSGNVYLQITRGVAPRNHVCPSPSPEPTIVIITRPKKFPLPEEEAFKARRVITFPDIRWGRRDIKSVSLLANCMALTEATRRDAYEAILYEPSGSVTEAASHNAWMVTNEGEVWTRQLGTQVLPGTTRGTALEVAQKQGVVFRQKAFSVEELKGASEVFLTGTTPLVVPIGVVDETVIGDGKMGPVTQKLLLILRERIFALGEQAPCVSAYGAA